MAKISKGVWIALSVIAVIIIVALVLMYQQDNALFSPTSSKIVLKKLTNN
jgi:hypothetical protein